MLPLVPCYKKMRRLLFEVPQEVSEELTKLERSEMIERIDASGWFAPIMVPRETSGDIPVCVALRKPNILVVLDSRLLLCPDELFHQLSGACVFSKRNLSSAYRPLDPRKRKQGHYSFRKTRRSPQIHKGFCLVFTRPTFQETIVRRFARYARYHHRPR